MAWFIRKRLTMLVQADAIVVVEFISRQSATPQYRTA